MDHTQNDPLLNYIELVFTKAVEEKVACFARAKELFNSIKDAQEVQDDYFLTATPQASEMTGDQAITLQETVEYVDLTEGQKIGEGARDDIIAETDQMKLAPLAEFLSRPVRILSTTWLESDAIGNVTSIYPWYRYLNDTNIKYKLNNYSWIRGNLHLKILVNSSPFYYGLTMFSYRPLSNFPDTVTAVSGNNEWVGRSQRPHIFVKPQTNEGGEMVLPFFYPANWVNLQSASELQNLGILTQDILYVLSSANGATGVGVNIQIYAWMSEVELSGPSVGLAVQSGFAKPDEYGQGSVSKPASAFAAFCDTLTTVPVIGKFATATSIGARAVSTIASMFGYTNVPVIEDTKGFRSQPFPQLSSSEIGYPIEKLTLDPKNELSIDPTMVGLPSEDSLAISNLVSRESLLTTTYWSTSDTVDSQLFASSVTPWLIRTVTQTNQYVTDLPPMAWVANLFAHWRGDIIFRFLFVKSKYHRGRVAISYDPSGYTGSNIIQTTNTTSVVTTKIIDLGAEESVEMRVPYAQALPFLNTLTPIPHNVWVSRGSDTSGNFTYDATAHNGMICMRVLNVLTAPVATSQIGIIVSVRGAENLEFANPQHVGEFSPFTVQSGETFMEGSEEHTIDNVSPDNKVRYLTNFGECICSLRALLRRSSLNEVYAVDSDTTSYARTDIHKMTRWPVPYGYDPSGLWSAKGLVATASNFSFNYTFSTPLNWVMPAFVGVRGSTIWTFNTMNLSNTPSPVEHIRVIRTPNIAISQATRNYVALTTKGNVNTNTNYFRQNWYSGQGGQSLTNGRTQTGLNVLLPNYTGYKFQSTGSAYATAPPSSDGSRYDTSVLEIFTSPLYGSTTRALFVEKHVGIGTDFNLYWFLNVPTFYWYRGTIVPT